MKISRKLFIAFITLTMVLLASLGSITFIISEQTITSRVSDQLESVASIQKARINELANDVTNTLSLIVNSTSLQSIIQRSFQYPNDTENLDLINNTIFDILESSENLLEISITTSLGDVIASTNNTKINTSLSSTPYFDGGKDKILLFHPVKQANNELDFINVAPIMNGTTQLGVLIITAEATDLLNLVQDYSGLGKSGETVLAMRETNGNALFLTPLKFDENASLVRSVSHDETDVPITQALLKNEKFFLNSIDYRNVSVLATTRYIEVLDWGVVVKIDKSEAFAPIYILRENIIQAGVILLVIVSILSYIIAQWFTEPLKLLTKSADRIAKGDYTERVTIDRKDEIGKLGVSFNEMTENLIAAKTDLERRVKERTEDLEKSNAELQLFAYVASHDLREPLRTITNFLQLLERKLGTELDLDAKEYINYATSGAIRMKLLIDDLLAYSRVGTTRKEFISTDLTIVLEEAIDNLKVTIEENNAQIKYGKLPKLKIDEPQLIQVFQNLIGNSIKFKSKEQPIIEVSVKETSSSFIISLKDNGVGIEEPYQEKIFVIFQRLHTRSEYPGTGIGLAICKKIIDNHHGKIWVESKIDKGATFYIVFPMDGINLN